MIAQSSRATVRGPILLLSTGSTVSSCHFVAHHGDSAEGLRTGATTPFPRRRAEGPPRRGRFSNVATSQMPDITADPDFTPAWQRWSPDHRGRCSRPDACATACLRRQSRSRVRSQSHSLPDADRAAEDLRRPGSHRHREHAAVRGGAGAHAELTEALEQQTATSEVLGIISSSPGELEPVFEAMLANAIRICEANFGVLFRFEDGAVRAAAMLGVPASVCRVLARRDRSGPVRKLPSVASSRRGRQFILPMSRWTRLTLRVNRSSWPPSISEASGQSSTFRCSRKMS